MLMMPSLCFVFDLLLRDELVVIAAHDSSGGTVRDE